jgi:hypothetical protein
MTVPLVCELRLTLHAFLLLICRDRLCVYAQHTITQSHTQLHKHPHIYTSIRTYTRIQALIESLELPPKPEPEPEDKEEEEDE